MRHGLGLFLMTTVLVANLTVARSETVIMGRASVIDGDTIEIHGERVRLNGVDAPESAQLCHDGQQRRYALDKFLAASRPTRCKFVERDRYGRFVGDCFRADGASVAATLVRSGWALDWPRYSKGEYADEQEAAKRESLGLWKGKFMPPWSGGLIGASKLPRGTYSRYPVELLEIARPPLNVLWSS
jgi:endonuclease YncB( thermonuclease family)